MISCLVSRARYRFVVCEGQRLRLFGSRTLLFSKPSECRVLTASRSSYGGWLAHPHEETSDELDGLRRGRYRAMVSDVSNKASGKIIIWVYLDFTYMIPPVVIWLFSVTHLISYGARLCVPFVVPLLQLLLAGIASALSVYPVLTLVRSVTDSHSARPDYEFDGVLLRRKGFAVVRGTAANVEDVPSSTYRAGEFTSGIVSIMIHSHRQLLDLSISNTSQ